MCTLCTVWLRQSCDASQSIMLSRQPRLLSGDLIVYSASRHAQHRQGTKPAMRRYQALFEEPSPLHRSARRHQTLCLERPRSLQGDTKRCICLGPLSIGMAKGAKEQWIVHSPPEPQPKPSPLMAVRVECVAWCVRQRKENRHSGGTATHANPMEA